MDATIRRSIWLHRPSGGQHVMRRSFSLAWLVILLLHGASRGWMALRASQRLASRRFLAQPSSPRPGLDQKERPPSISSYLNNPQLLSGRQEAVVLRNLSRSGHHEAIIDYLARFEPNVASYTRAMQALAGDEPSLVLDLYEELVSFGLRPTILTLAAVMSALRGPLQTRVWLERLRRDHADKFTQQSQLWDAALYACARPPLQGSMAEQTALVIYQQMMEKGVPPTPRTHAALLAVGVARPAMVQEAIAIVKRDGRMTGRLWGLALQACANEHQALAFLLRMHSSGVRPNVRHYTAYLKLLGEAGRIDAALHVLDHMNGESTSGPWVNLPRARPDLVALQTVLAACANDYTAARTLLQRIRDGDFDCHPSERCYNLVLAACTNATEARALIQEMRLSRRHRIGAIPPSHISYTRAIAACRRSADTEMARSLLRQAWMDGLDPDVYMYSAAIWTASDAQDDTCARQLLHEMKEQGLRPNTVSYNGLIASLCGRRPHEAVTVATSMMEGGLQPSRTTYQLLVKAVRSTNDLEERSVLLARIADTMGPKEWRAAVGGPIIELLITTYGSLGCFADAKRVYDSIQGPCDASLLRAILFACSFVHPPEWEQALAILHASDIVSGAPAPHFMDAIALSNAMLACSKANKWEESLQLLRLYGGHETSILAVNSLIGACGRNGRPDMAMEVLNDMDSFGISPDDRSYRNAIIACNHAEHERQRRGRQSEWTSKREYELGWWECALSLLRRMKEVGLTPDVQTYSSAISACEAAGEWQQALGILQSILDESGNNVPSSLNLYCFNAAISACEKAGAWVECLDIYERMKLRGGRSLQPNAVTISSLVLALDRAGQKELAISAFGEGVRRRAIMPWRNSLSSDGETLQVMDLHSFSAAMARTAVRSYMESVARERCEVIEDWVIVVGKGKHSDFVPVLKTAVLEILRGEFGLEARSDPTNLGRVIVPATSLKQYIERHTV